jgi:hypothetical protein
MIFEYIITLIKIYFITITINVNQLASFQIVIFIIKDCIIFINNKIRLDKIVRNHLLFNHLRQFELLPINITFTNN